jgi:3D (Asp-Asp-Asp) domain-containing protein
LKSIHVKRILGGLAVTGMLLAGGALPGVAEAATGGSSYQVNQGDTFWLISQRRGIALDKLMAANAGVDPYQLRIGMTLNLPGASSAPAGRSFVATGYSAAPAENGGAQWAGLDYFGNQLVQGRTIAVDPNVIPLGTSVWVSGYNWAGLPSEGFAAQATDVGSAIKGSRIDIYLDGSRQAVTAFGMQNVTVTVLK